MVNDSSTLEDLKQRAKAGDLQALQTLRNSGFFGKKAATTYPLSNAQRRLWIVSQMEQTGGAYNLPSALDLTGELHLQSLRRAFAALIQRHESLRTTFGEVQGEPRQTIHEQMSFVLDEIDAVRESNPAARARELMARDADQTFDLTKGPLLRAKLIRIGSDRHILYINVHHIVFDGWSTTVMLRDLGVFYDAYCKGTEVNLPALPMQYKEYAAWQQSHLKSDAGAQHRSYWMTKLSGELPVLALPTDFPRPPIKTFSGKSHTALIPQSLSDRIEKLGRTRGASLFMTLTAVVKMLFHKYTGQEDIIVGCPITGRDHPGLEDQIGLFLNALILRDQISADDSFNTVLDKVRTTASEAYAHQMYPFDQLVEDLLKDRDRSRTPLTDVMVALQNFEQADGTALGEIEVVPASVGFNVAKFDLSLHFSPCPQGLAFTTGYNTDLFLESRIQAMAGHFTQLLVSAAENPDRPLHALEILQPAERHRILEDFNRTDARVDTQATVISIFEDTVRRFPDTVAVVSGKTRLTYRELNERVNRITHVLRTSHTVRAGECIGLLLQKSEWMIAGILAIQKAGGAYVPLDPGYPAERIQYILTNSACRLVLTDGSPVNGIPSADLREMTSGHAENPPNQVSPTDLAYVLYTSGSTGQPKGVMIEHRSVVNLVAALREALYARFSDVGAQNISLMSSFVFDASVKQIFAALLQGRTLHLIGDELKTDGRKLVEYLEENRIDISDGTPGLFSVMTEQWTAAKRPTTIRHFVLGGEALSLELLRAFYSVPGHEKIGITNVYGPTECCVNATLYTINGASDLPRHSVPIGKPLRNIRAYIVDPHFQPVPVGIAGELCLSGIGLARGYIGNADLTSEKFVIHPFRENERLYKTGDLARWEPDGNILFLGRNDDQVKIRGYRIELGEIGHHLARCPGVKEQFLIARESATGRDLIAYIVPTGTINVESVRETLKKNLPDYMIPAFFVVLEKLPLNRNGKVDRRALPAPAPASQAVSEKAATHAVPEAQAPTHKNELESKLAAIWCKVLECESAAPSDNFYELGGHSLSAIMLVSKIRRDLQVEFGLRDVFRAPTLSGMAKLIEQKNPKLFNRIERVADAEHFAVSNAQRRLWILERITLDKSAYSLFASVQIQGELNFDALHKSFAALVDRHESLRTTFVEVDGQPRQRIQKFNGFEVQFSDLSAELDLDEKARAILRTDAAVPFDLSTGPLFRVRVLRVSPDRHVLFYNMHHIISDGWSIGILIEEVSQLYASFCAGKTSPLQPLRIQYRDYAAWQNKQLAGPEGEKQKKYWLSKMGGELPLLDLPADFPRPQIRTFQGGVLRFTLPREVSQGILKHAKDHAASTFTTVVTLVKMLIHRYTGQSDLIVGAPVAGREHSDLSGQIGFFVNMLALRDTVARTDSFAGLLQKVKITVGEALENQAYAFDKLVEDLALKRDTARSPVFDVAIGMQNTTSAAAKSAQQADAAQSVLPITPFPIQNTNSKFDITFHFAEIGGGLEGGIEFSTDLFTPARIERMRDHFIELARSAASAPNAPLSDLNILPAWERQKVIAGFNQTARDYPREKTIAACFEECVRRYSDRAAVTCRGATLTYAELNERANRVAHCLKNEYRVEPGECIGVLLGRSEWCVVSLLGILKAGAAYVPIDPAYPAPRIEYMLADLRCRIVLSLKREIDLFASTRAQNAPAVITVDLSDITGPTEDPPSVGNGESLAYVIYTSGSTGTPKGSLIDQRSVLRLVLNTNYIQIRENDRLIQTGSLAFDASTFEIWGALLNGACVCLPDEADLLEPAALSRWMSQNGITVMFVTTSLFNQFAEADIRIFSSLRVLLTGGEKVSVRHFNHIRRLCPNLLLSHVYGPTENTTFSTYYPVDQVFEHDIPIGFPIANSTVYILEPGGQPAPIGIPGEICTGGDGVARGYLNQPQMTSEKFVANPFVPGERIYRSGDLGCWLPDGAVAFFGRIDNQVKVRGFRIEPGEIEARILGENRVKEAVVTSRKTAIGTTELAAYFSGDTDFGVNELRAYLSGCLPDYMVPAHLVKMERLPLNLNGKVDRRALPAPETLAPADADFAAPRDEKETMLAGIWQAVLARPKIGINENYFELGGDSIKAIQIVSRVKRPGWHVEVRDLFQNPTIASLATRLKKPESAGAVALVSGELPLTPVQRWFFEIYHGEIHHFNQAVLLHWSERIDERVLRAVLEQLSRHHDILRVTFRRDKNQVIQRIAPSAHTWDLKIADLRGMPHETECLEEETRMTQRGIDLEKGPLAKAVLLRLNDADRLLLVIHHLAVDGVSWRILLEDLEQGYRQYAREQKIELGAKTVTFDHWARACESFANSDALNEDLKYWSQLESQSAATLPISAEGTAQNTYGTCESARVTLSVTETATILSGAHRAWHTEINDLLLAALARALNRWHGQKTTYITLEGHGRERLEKEYDLTRTAGWFTTLYPVVLESFEDAGRQIRATKENLRRIPRKGLSRGLIRYMASPERRAGILNSEAPRISFNYLGQFEAGQSGGLFDFASESAGVSISPALKRHNILDFGGIVNGEKFELSLVFCPALLSKEIAAGLLEHFKNELITLAEYCRSRSTPERTPGDFTACPLTLDEYDAMLKERGWQAAQVEDVYPLSPMQQGLLFQGLMEPASRAYLLQTSYRINGRVDLEAYWQSWNELCRRHTILRTAFVHENVSRTLQVVFWERAPETAWIDLSDLYDTEQRARIREHQQLEKSRGFDLQSEPLMRVAIFKLGTDRFQVVWTYHHILLDGWALGILYSDFTEIYRAFSQKRQAQLPAPVAYSNYIRWIVRQNEDSARKYWTGYLDGYEQLATVPQLAHITGENGRAEFVFELPLDLSNRVRDLASATKVTLNTVIQSAWALVLSRYNNSNDVFFGAIVSGRPADLPGVEKMAGLFINAVPVRAKLSDSLTFEALAAAIQKDSLESEPHQHLPLPEIQRCGTLRPKLFDHVVVFENFPVEHAVSTPADSAANDFSISEIEAFDQTHFDFDLIVVPGQKIRFTFNFNPRLFSKEQISTTAQHLCNTLANAAPRPHVPVNRIDIMTPAERQMILTEFSGKTLYAAVPAENIIEMFELQATASPRKTALVLGTESVSYSDLNRHANSLASILQQRGVGAESCVGICVERSPEMIVAILAVLKTGGAYVPLDPAYPRERLAFMLEDASPRLLLTQRKFKDLMPAPAATVLCIEDIKTENVGDFHGLPIHAENPAYVIYTSGSTGKPKGTVVPHAALASYTRAAIDTYKISATDRVLQFSSISFDAALEEIFPCLASGATLVLRSDEMIGDAAAFFGGCAEQKITFLSLPTAFWQQLAAGLAAGLASIPQAIRLVSIGGEKARSESVAKWFTAAAAGNSRVELMNTYGPTETTVIATACTLSSPNFGVNGPPIGRPISNSLVYILDAQLNPVPVGAPGELFIGGRALARGYRGRSDATAERFIPDPFSDEPGVRMYRTGDLVRFVQNGSIEFLGRIDKQVKVRGFRVEVEEIEAALASHPDVRQAAVVARELPDGDVQLLAFASALKDRTISASNLRSHLQQSLPEYMIPSAFTILDALPLTPSGKLDRRELPALTSPAEHGNAESYTAPFTPLQRDVVHIWEDVLQLPRVGIHDNFFERGGHSLKAIQVLSRIQKLCGAKVSIREFFTRPTIAGLCDAIATARIEEISRIQPVPSREYHELSHAQERLWLQHLLDGASAYNMPKGYLFELDFDLPVLKRALARLIERHEALRTAFVDVDGVPRQIIAPSAEMPFREIDLSGSTNAESEARAIVTEEALVAFDLARPPLMRALLLVLPQNRRVLLLIMHHIIGDGWSMNVFHKEIYALYEAFRRGEPDPLKTPRIQYKDFAAWQNRKSYQREEHYWMEKMEGAPEALKLPCDIAAADTRLFEGKTERLALNPALVSGLRQIALGKNTTVSNVVLSIFNLLLFQLTKQDDFCIGMSIANRNHPDLENLIGFFVNLLPIRVRMTENLEFDALLDQVIHNTYEAFEHQDYPFDLLVRKLNPARVANRQPFINVVYAFQNFADVHVDLGETSQGHSNATKDGMENVKNFEFAFETSKFDLTLFVTDTGAELLFALEYDSGIFKPGTARKILSLIERFAKVLVNQKTQGALNK